MLIMVDNNLIIKKNYEPYTYDPYADEHYLYDYDWYDYRPRYPIKSDLRIKEDIEDELFWSCFEDAHDVDVNVKVEGR